MSDHLNEDLPPSLGTVRTRPLFVMRLETASEKLGWLNRILAVGIGHRRADGPIYSVFELL